MTLLLLPERFIAAISGYEAFPSMLGGCVSWLLPSPGSASDSLLSLRL